MARVSIDNGNTYCTATEALEKYPLGIWCFYMDPDTMETVHNEIAPCTDLEFLERYIQIAPSDLVIG